MKEAVKHFEKFYDKALEDLSAGQKILGSYRVHYHSESRGATPCPVLEPDVDGWLIVESGYIATSQAYTLVAFHKKQ